MKRFLVILLFIANCSFAQKEGNIWYFGWHAGLDFNKALPVALTNSAMVAIAGCASISDANGNLLFYTDGDTVYNKNHQKMQNGTGLWGGISTQSGLIVPMPRNKNIYYIFTNISISPIAGLRYSIVDMTLDNGLGGITAKDIFLVGTTTEKITAVLHSNNRAVWIITHGYNNNAFYSFLLTNTGINPNYIVSNCGSIQGQFLTRGYSKASPDGKKIALTCGGTQYGLSELYDFDNSTGSVSNAITLNYNSNFIGGYGIEFSPDCSKLYISASHNNKNCIIYQFDLKTNNPDSINNSAIIINEDISDKYALQIAPDGKIYGAGYNRYVAVINNPNVKGINCNYRDSGIYLNGKSSCMGLPTMMQSYFFIPDFTAQPLCYGDITKFGITDTNKVDSVRWNFGDPSTGNNNISKSFTPTHRFCKMGNYIVNLYLYHQYKLDSNYTKLDSTSREIKITPYPIAKYLINDSIQCLKENKFDIASLSTICCGKISYEWQFGDSTNSYDSNTSHSYKYPDTFKVKLIAISDYGCTDTFTRNVYINPTPDADFSINNPRQCLTGNSFLFTNKSQLTWYKNPLLDNLQYNWDLGDKTNDTSTNISHSYKINDTFQVRLIATSMQGCRDTVIKTVIVDPMPKVAFNINDSGQCLSGNLFIYSNQSNVTGNKIIKPIILNYKWTFGDNAKDTATNPKHSYLSYDTFDVKLIAVTNMGCSDSMTKEVITYPMPKAVIYVNDSVQCLNGNLYMFSHQAKNPVIKNQIYLWNFGDNNKDTSENPLHQYKSANNYHVSMLITTDRGCKDSTNKQITVLASPKADFSINDSNQCYNTNKFQFTNLSSISSGNIHYLWDFGDSNMTLNISPVHTYKKFKDSYLVKLITESGFKCSDTVEKTVYIKSSPVVRFIVNDSAQCLYSNSFAFINYTHFQEIVPCVYKWSFGDGMKNDTSTSPIHSYINSNLFTVSLLAITTGGCRDSITKNVTVYPVPKALFTVNDTAQCVNTNQFVFINQTQTTVACKYLWDFGDMDSSTNVIPTHKYLSDGKYTIQLIATNIDNCRDTTTGNVTVLPKPKADYHNTVGCLLDTIYFTDLSTMKAPEIIKSWYWDFKNGNTSNSQNPSSIYLTAGAYGVMLIVGSNQGCYDTAIHYLNFYDHPQPPVIKYVSVVNNNEVSIEWIPSNLGVAKNYIIERSLDNNNYSTIGTVNNNITEIKDDHVEAKKYSYFYRVYTIDSCNYQTGYSNVSKTILLKDTSGDRYTSIVWSAYLGWLNGVNNYEVQIYNDNQNSYETITTINDTNYDDNQTKLDQESYCYRVTAHEKGSDVVSYSDSDCITTPLTGWVPNAFTPNHDGINDQLVIQGRFIVDYNMAIYNRWGVEMFHSNDVNKSWDGTYHGQPCEAGYYLFWVSFKGTRGQAKMVKGEMMLIK